MQRFALDRDPAADVGWPFDRCYAVESYAFRLRSESVAIGAVLDGLWSRFRTPPRPGAPEYTVLNPARAGGWFRVEIHGRVEHAEAPHGIIDLLLWDMTRRAVGGLDGRIAVHAGAVAAEGRAVVLPAAPDSGKTTLVGGLVRAGCAYLSDEAALVDPRSGIVHPFPKPLWMDRASVDVVGGLWDRLPPERVALAGPHFHVTIDDLGGDVSRPAEIAAVVFPTYRHGAVTALRPMGRAAALAGLIANCFNFSRFGRAGLEALAGVVARAACYELTVGDLRSAVDEVTAVLAPPPTA